jgi:hypothetical protein
MAELEISKESVCFIILEAREFEEQLEVVEDDPGSDLLDGRHHEVIARDDDDATYDEVKQFIESIDLDEQCDLVALAWLGRGDFDLGEWAKARELARDRHNEHTAEYLLGMPLLADYLQAGLDAFGISCEEIEEERL